MQDAQTWHYGLIARWWSEFNDDFRPHEVPYFRRYIERDGSRHLTSRAGRAAFSFHISVQDSTSTAATSPPT